jgi:MFS family permease
MQGDRTPYDSAEDPSTDASATPSAPDDVPTGGPAGEQPDGQPGDQPDDQSGDQPGGQPGGQPGAAPRRGGAFRAGAATGRGLARTGRGGAAAATYVFRQARRATHAEGAGQSGLSRIIELHAFNAAGDAAVAISLAGTLFFQVPTAEARGQVALFLGLTMLPFAVVAPLIGPVLDRFTHGRRWAIGLTMALRAFLCWVLAGEVAKESLTMFPAALGVLVASKAYGVTRAAAVPRVVPQELGLVKANSRISLAGMVGAAVSAPLAVGASMLGAEWSLRYAFLVFVGGTILAILLPAQVDDAAGEQRARLSGRARVPAVVVRGLRCNGGLRVLSGFLTLFMAFLLRDKPFPGWEDKPELLLALVIGSAGLGNAVGIGLGNVLREVRPAAVVVLVLIADTAAVTLAALFYGLPTVVLLGLVAGVSQALGKLSLDSLIQQEVPERSRASAFARSETLIQLSWVAGGLLGIALPLIPRVGLGVAALLLVAITVWVLMSIRTEKPSPA